MIDYTSEANTTTSTFMTACEDIVVTDVTSGVITVTIKESVTPDGFFKKRSFLDDADHSIVF